MLKPLVAIHSSNPRLTSELPLRLQDRFRFLVADTPEEARDIVRGHRPRGFLADLTGVRGNGEAEERLLEDLTRLCPGMQVVALVPPGCPELLEQRIAAGGISMLSGFVTAEQLAALLSDRLPETASRPTGVESPGPVAVPHGPPATAVPVPDAGDPVEAAVEVPGAPVDFSGATAADGDSGKPLMVLSGISRRFETNSPRLQAMLDDLEVAARHNVTILLIGETGSGKTFLSRLIHEISPRRDEPFLTVACGALPAELIESELFGHVKGAFTSAHADKEGKFVAAGRGTVLLDEIDVLGPEQQVKLLRVIETGEFEAVGSNRTLKGQARLVVASNLDLQPLVEQGRFRPDLYYRLNMLKFELLPLRERKMDILPLARRFIQRFAGKHGIEIRRIEPSLFEALLAYPWPGNVRELENVIQRAVIFSRDGVLSSRSLPSHIVSGVAGPTNDPSVQLRPQEPATQNLGRRIAWTERDIIEQALFRNNYSRTNTARDLGISRVTLYNKMKKYGMLK